MENVKYIKSKNKNIHYRILGKGKPVVLLHGFCEDGNIWNDLAESLQNHFQFIIPDLPGSGKSEMLTGENITIEDYAEVVKLIIENEVSKVSPEGEGLVPIFRDLERAATIIGHSMGGYIALAFAAKYPDFLEGLVLFHSSAFADDEEKKQARLKSINFIKQNGAYEYMKTAVPNLFADKHHPQIKVLIKQGNSFTPGALIQYLTAMMVRPDRTDVLKSLKIPVLYLIGEKDTAVPLEASLKQCHIPAVSHVNILENAEHMGMIENIEICSNIISSFMIAITHNKT
jgi:pimeloyl-ACP methyl ester carboxylesterase